MKRFFEILAVVALVVSCSKVEDVQYNNEFVLTGYSAVDSRTEFGTPDADKIPYFWSAGDYIWLGTVRSKAIAERCKAAQFKWENEPSTFGDYHVFYNMTGSDKNAKVLASQTADGNLGNDGDFGYALADEYKTFVLEHKTSYIWFDTTSSDVSEKLVSISVTAVDGVCLAGEREYDYVNDAWCADVVNGANRVVLNFGEGVVLKPENEGVFAAMVTLPSAVGGTELTIVYTFADGATFTEVRSPKKDLTAGAVQRVATTIAKADLKSEPQMRVLTFEDADCKGNVELGSNKYYWSEFIPSGMQASSGHGSYWWVDETNTELMFEPVAGDFGFYGGHAGISNYVGTDWQNEGSYMYDLQAYNVTGGHSGTNFNTHFGYIDTYDSGFGMNNTLPSLTFWDGEARVIDHMWVTNTTYVYNQLQAAGFGSTYVLSDESTFKIVAYGFESEDDNEPTKAEFYLLNKGKQFVTEWTKWDLSVLGKVVKVSFNMEGSEDMIGDYGLSVPAYFAYDDVAVIF